MVHAAIHGCAAAAGQALDGDQVGVKELVGVAKLGLNIAEDRSLTVTVHAFFQLATRRFSVAVRAILPIMPLAAILAEMPVERDQRPIRPLLSPREGWPPVIRQ